MRIRTRKLVRPILKPKSYDNTDFYLGKKNSLVPGGTDYGTLTLHFEPSTLSLTL